MGKTCPKCQTPDADFGPNKARKDGLQVYCRSCMKAFRLARGYDSTRWQEKREQESERNRKYRADNAERLRSYKKERSPVTRSEFASVIRARNIARKHGERRATPKWADHAAMNAVYAQAKRLQGADGVPRHVDHQVPLKHPLVCGLHVPANLQILSATENMSKHNSFVECW